MVSLSDFRKMFNRIVIDPVVGNNQGYWEAFNTAVYGDAFKGAAKYIKQEAENNRVVILADSNHGNMTRNAFIASPELMSEARKGGITHFAIEASKLMQPLIDELATGKINKSTFVNITLALADANIYHPTCINEKDLKRDLEYQADQIINASKNGIKTVAIDNGISTVSYLTKDGKAHFDGMGSAVAGFIKDFIPFAKKSPYFNTDLSTLQSSDFGMIERKEIVRKHFDESKHVKDFTKSIVATLKEPTLDFRLQNDYRVALTVMNEIGSSGKMLINYGAGHTNRQKTDIDALLNQANIKTKVIDVHGNINDFLSLQCNPDNKIGGCEGPYAHDRVFLDRGTLEKAGVQGALPKPIPLTQFNR